MRVWIKLVFGLAAIVLMLALIVGMGRLALGVLRANDTEDVGVPDPMFAEEAVMPTKPPELSGAEMDGTEHEDNSANWDTSVQTPVDQNAEELAEEARSQAEVES